MYIKQADTYFRKLVRFGNLEETFGIILKETLIYVVVN